MTHPKIDYQSKSVIVASGPAAYLKAAEMAGQTPEYTEAMIDFAKDIIRNAMDSGIVPDQCYTACLNAMVQMILMLDPAQQQHLVNVTVEALCAAIGGGADDGRRDV